MTLSRFFTVFGYAAATAATIIVSGGIAAPAWVAAVLTGAATISAHLAQSPVPCSPKETK